MPARGVGHRCEGVDVVDPHEHGDRTADPVRVQLGERGALGRRVGQPVAQVGGQRCEVGGHAHDTARINHSSGTVVRSPAPRVSTTSPGRARRSACCTTSVRRGR